MSRHSRLNSEADPLLAPALSIHGHSSSISSNHNSAN